MTDTNRTTDPVSHTPAPWHIEERTDSEGYWIAIPAPIGRKVIAEIDTGFDEPWDSQQHANAHLIAAAPDLLTSLRELVAWQAEVKHAVPLIYLERARAAIAKAEGR